MFSIEPVERSSSTDTWWPRGEQRLGQVRSDEAGPAGDERTHDIQCP